VKIILTHGYFLSTDIKEQEIMRPYVPLGILYISSYLDSQGFANDVFDATFSSPLEQRSYLVKEQPDVLGVYTNLMTKIQVLELIKFIKGSPSLSHCKVVLGGPEVRHHQRKFLDYGADIVVVGEGELTMLDLMKHHAGQGFERLEEIAGISYLGPKGELIQNKERELNDDLDAMPFPARDKINLQQYFDVWKAKHGESTISISTMRGCPYDCKWCSRAVYGQSYRRRSAEKVVDEMLELKSKYQFDKIWFVDDVFTVNYPWMRLFADEVKRRNAAMPFEIISRSDRLNEEMLSLLKESGCFRVWIGAESGSQKVIDAMSRRVKVKQVREMIKLTRSMGIEAGTFIMLGYPGERESDIKETLQHLLHSDPDHYTITLAYPIKGTPLYEEVQPYFTTNLDWAKSNDRMIDFKRRYTRKYYDYAIRWIYNEVAFHKASKKAFHIRNVKYLFKAWASYAAMLYQRANPAHWM
jgi:anaerobic magnesium-protoporphyrin IX monomethyl ester cyclase